MLYIQVLQNWLLNASLCRTIWDIRHHDHAASDELLRQDSSAPTESGRAGKRIRNNTLSWEDAIYHPHGGFCVRLKHSETMKMMLMKSFIYRLLL